VYIPGPRQSNVSFRCWEMTYFVQECCKISLELKTHGTQLRIRLGMIKAPGALRILTKRRERVDIWPSHVRFTTTPCSKKGDTELMAVSLLIINRFTKNFAARFSSKFAAKYLVKISPHLICVATLPCETLMSENERQSPTNVVINDKLQGTAVTYLRCGRLSIGWLGSRVVSVLDSGAEGPGFKLQSRRCRVTVLGKLFTPIVPLFTKQQNW